MRKGLFILLILLGKLSSGATYTSVKAGSWNDPTVWGLAAGTTIDPNSTFNIYHTIFFDGWNPTSSSWAQIRNTSGCFKTSASYSNTNAVIQLSSTGLATGAIDVSGDLSVGSIIGNTGSAISPSLKATGNISMQNLATYNNGHTFNFSCQDFSVSQNYNYRDASSQYKDITTNLNITGNASINNLYSAGTLNINKPSGSANLTVSNIYSDATKDFTCSVDGNINVTSNIEVKKNSTFTSGGTMTLANGLQNTVAATNFTVNGSLELSNGFNNNTRGTTTVNNGNLYVRSNTSAGKLNAATINVNNGSMICKQAAAASYWDLAIDNNTASVNISGGNLELCNLTLSNSSAPSVSVSGNLTTYQNGSVSITGNNARLTVGGNVSTYDFKQNVSSAITTISGNLTASHSLTDLQGIVTVGGSVNFGQDFFTGNNVNFTVGGNVTTSGNGKLQMNANDKLTIGGSFSSGANDFEVMVNGTLQIGGSFTVPDLNTGTNNSSGTIIVGGDFTVADTDGGSNAFFRNDGALTVHGKVTADHVELNSSNGSARVTIFGPAATHLIELNGGKIIPKTSDHMPIELTSFSVRAQTSSTILSWTTASELNNKYFIVERSTDGSSFSEIAQVQGAGTSNLTHLYQSVDNGVAKGTYYYRLRQVDENGTESLSKVISVTISSAAATKMQLLPSVVKSGEAITCAFDVPVAAIVDVIDIRGVVLACYTADANSSLQIKTDNLQAGMYFARLNETGEVRRFIVK